ncbi:MAG: gene transfer agent family protein [Paracoccus sp. (in: a-proteobacteria)]|uniref:gene transfer agent family protein n=1 Tax=Paracoccus sp. TaxID=267 RepID=UPI0026DEFBFD|nr:gene transfer agent family protein [Paracoccus sp. (in: a-proteobacteria)]MDO5630442.1 gene transfer agent family protein [Paracoccus sp. (in: a-proteobacteria)]
MANPMAGEVDVVLNGEVLTARLTLGALAELEQDLKAESLLVLVERFEQGRFSARDVLAVLAAGLRGGGWRGRVDDLLAADIGGGPLAAARLAAALLAHAFRLPE